VRKVLRVLQGRRGKLVRLAPQVLPGRKALKVPRVRKASKVYRVFKVFREKLGRQV
jgi:hypothetical protein